MLVRFPVKLENGVVVVGNEEPFDFENGQKFNGVDVEGNRVTNIVGFDGSYLLKWCPHCYETHISLDFGPEGRANSDQKRRRDQSWCMICRRESHK